MGDLMLRRSAATWSMLVHDAPILLSGRRLGGDLCILAYKAIGNANICATLYTGDQRMFGAP